LGEENKMKKKIVGILIVTLFIGTALNSLAYTSTTNSFIDQLDQSQTNQTDHYYLTRWFAYAQSFKPDATSLTRVQLYFRHSGATNNIILSIRDNLDGSDLSDAIVNPSVIPINVWTWVEFNVDDISVTPGNTYYILVYHISSGDLDVIAWGCSNVNIYFDGTGWEKEIWTDPPGLWTILDNVDFCFKTYGEFNDIPNRPSCSYEPITDVLTISATDPDNDEVKYGVSWDDDENIDTWTEYVPSGTEKQVSCGGRKGTVGVIAEDEHGAQSVWLSVRYKPKTIHTPLLTFLEKYPNLFPLIRLIMGL
jgi:hypothetical protein